MIMRLIHKNQTNEIAEAFSRVVTCDKTHAVNNFFLRKFRKFFNLTISMMYMYLVS